MADDRQSTDIPAQSSGAFPDVSPRVAPSATGAGSGHISQSTDPVAEQDRRFHGWKLAGFLPGEAMRRAVLHPELQPPAHGYDDACGCRDCTMARLRRTEHAR